MKTKLKQVIVLSVIGVVLTGTALFLYNNPSTSHLFEFMKSSAIGGQGGSSYTTLETDSDGKWDRTGTWEDGDKPGDDVDADEIVYIRHDCRLNKDIEVYGQLIITSNGTLVGVEKKIKLKNGGSITAAGEIRIKAFEIEGGTFSSSAYVHTKEKFKVDGDAEVNLTGFLFVKKKLELKNGANVTFGDSVHVKGEIKIEDAEVDFGDGLYAKKKIEINKGSTVTFDGNVYANAKIDKIKEGSTVSIDGTFYCKGEFKMDHATLNVAGSLEVNNKMKIEKSSSEINVSGALYVKNNFENDGDVNVETSTSRTGAIYIGGSSAGEEVELKFKRYIQKDGWHYVSSPITDAKTDVLWGGAVYSYNEPDRTWTSHGAGEDLVPGEGYDVYFKNNHKTLTFSGEPNTGEFSHTLTYTSGTGDGYNLVGNPYPCAIDWESASGWTRTNISSTVYVWDDQEQNITTYTIGGASTNGGSAVIPPTMAFFVQVSSVGEGTLAMTEDVRVSDIENFRKRKVIPKDQLSLKIKGAGFSDETIVRFNDEALDELDLFDAEKLYSYNVQVPQIYTKINDNLPLAVNTLTNLDRNLSVPVYFNAKVAGDYTIDFKLMNFKLPVNIYLEDQNTGNMTDLNAESYTFNTSQVEDDNRFILHFIPFTKIDQETSDTNKTTTGIEEFDNEKFNIYTSGKTVYIKANDMVEDGLVKIFDVRGREIKSGKFDNNVTNSYYMGTATGYYIVSVFENGKVNSRKVLIR